MPIFLLPALLFKARDSYHGISYLTEYHKRIVLTAGCFILTLLGLPLALKSKAGSRNIGIPLGLSFFIFYYVLITAAKGMCDSTSLPIWLVMWSPNILFTFLTIIILTITAQENWETVIRKINQTLQRFSSKLNE